MAIPSITTPLARIDLTQLDYNGIVNQIKSIIKTHPKYQAKFNSLFEGDAGVMLIELFAQIAQLNNLRIDFTANELSWLNAEQQQTILNFLPLIDYRLPSVKGSTTNIIATVINEPGAISTTQILLPGRTKLSALNLEGKASTCEILPSQFNYTGDIILQPGISRYSLNVFAGITSFLDVKVNKSSLFTFKINQTNVIDDSIQVFLFQNNTYTLLNQVDSFISPLGTLPSYTVMFDFFGSPTIVFGNKFFGGSFDGIVETDPTTWQTIRVYFRYLTDSTGSVTNYTPGAINQTLDFFIPAEGRKIKLQFFNQEVGAGGDDIPDIDTVKQIAPLTIRTADKAVTNEDCEIFLSQSSLVKDVLVVTPNEEPTLSIPIFHAHGLVAPNRINSTFIPITSPPLDTQLPEPLPSETQDEYNVRFQAALTNFYNVTGMETSAHLDSTLTDTVYPIVLDVNDTMRIVLDTEDIISGFVTVKLTENFSKPGIDIVNEINENFLQPIAFLNQDNSISLISPTLGDGSFLQLIGDNTDVFNDGIISQTYTTLGFVKNSFSTGLAQTLEAGALDSLVADKLVLGVELIFRPIVISPFKLTATVFFNKNSSRTIVEQNIRDALYNNFSYQASFMSKNIIPSKIAKIIQDIDGVDDATVILPADRLNASVDQIFFILDQFIIDNLPSTYPDMHSLYDIELNMIRSV